MRIKHNWYQSSIYFELALYRYSAGLVKTVAVMAAQPPVRGLGLTMATALRQSPLP